MNSTLELYQKAQETVRSRFADAKSAVSSPMEFVRSLLSGEASPAAPDAGEVERLRRRIQELEGRLGQLDKPGPRPSKRKRPA